MSEAMQVYKHDCVFEQVRGRLFGLAYRMTGSVVDAEDIVQETHLRWIQQEHDRIENPPGWLLTVVTRLGIDWQRNRRHRREHYVGVWLPEPLLNHEANPDHSPHAKTEFTDSMTLAFLHLLERLNAHERAVILLRDAFDWRFNDIAMALDATDVHCRQWYHRAHKKLGRDKAMTRPETHADRLLLPFLHTCMTGDFAALLKCLRDDVTVYSDGGGNVTALQRPISGGERVTRFLLRLLQPKQNMKVIMQTINGEPGLLAAEHGQVIAAMIFAFRGQKLWRIYSIRNPDKLTHLHSAMNQ